MKNSHFFICLLILFYGCSSNSKLSSSFGERKYTKGYFLDLPEARNNIEKTATHPFINNNRLSSEKQINIVSTIRNNKIKAVDSIHSIISLKKQVYKKVVNSKVDKDIKKSIVTVERIDEKPQVSGKSTSDSLQYKKSIILYKSLVGVGALSFFLIILFNLIHFEVLVWLGYLMVIVFGILLSIEYKKHVASINNNHDTLTPSATTVIAFIFAVLSFVFGFIVIITGSESILVLAGVLQLIALFFTAIAMFGNGSYGLTIAALLIAMYCTAFTIGLIRP